MDNTIKNTWTLTPRLFALFTQEVSGQLSDGNWENSYPTNHWEFWANMNVVEGDTISYVRGNYVSSFSKTAPTKMNGYDLVSLAGSCGVDLSDRMRAYVVGSMFDLDEHLCSYADSIIYNGDLPDYIYKFSREAQDKEPSERTQSDIRYIDTVIDFKAMSDIVPAMQKCYKHLYTRDECIADLKLLKKEMKKVLNQY